MNEMIQTFHIRQDESNNWMMIGANGRIYARSPFKDTIIDLARQIARNRAPSIVRLHASNGTPQKNWSYSKHRREKQNQPEPAQNENEPPE